MKTYKELMEEIRNVVKPAVETPEVDNDEPVKEIKAAGYTANEMGVYEINHLKQFAKKFSQLPKKNLEQMFADIETELQKFAFTLGKIDTSDIEDEDADSEDFVIFKFATHEEVKNIYLSLDWSKLDAPTTFDGRPEIYKIQATLTVNEIDPADFDDMVADALGED